MGNLELAGYFALNSKFRAALSLSYDFEVDAILRQLHFGKAVALVNVTGCIPTERARCMVETMEAEGDFGEYDDGRYAWITGKPHMHSSFTSFAVTGKQGLFKVTLPDDFEPVAR